MAKAANKNTPPKSRWLKALAVTGACVVVASLAFISLELAMLGAGFFIVTGFVASDIRRRRFWENGLSFRIKRMGDEHNSLVAKVSGARQDILNIKQYIADINRRMSMQDERIDELQAVSPGRPIASKTAPADKILSSTPRPRPANAHSSPAAIKPGVKPAPVMAPIRGAPDEDYDDLSDMVVRELINHAVRSRSIDIFVQPIVRLPQRKVRFYEMFARVRARPGMYVPARRYMKIAEQSQVTNDIDNMLLMECLKTLRASAHIERAAPLFLNISKGTLKNTTFMKRLVAFIGENRHLAPRIVFELPHDQYNSLEPAPRELLRLLGRLGCSVSIDHVAVMEFDISNLQKYNVRFVKISARTMLPYTRSDRGRADLQKIKRKLESNGVNVIVEKIEKESDLVELMDFDISYGQGHLFGRPDLEAAYRKRRAA
jgi:cyclic-di-GMP phosphodiesterase TipF (flagellum assembly factor)